MIDPLYIYYYYQIKRLGLNLGPCNTRILLRPTVTQPLTLNMTH